MNEDAAWQRLKDLQLEMENSHTFATRTLPAMVLGAQRVAARAWLLAGLAARRAPRRRRTPAMPRIS
jgi:hypothetical protein